MRKQPSKPSEPSFSADAALAQYKASIDSMSPMARAEFDLVISAVGMIGSAVGLISDAADMVSNRLMPGFDLDGKTKERFLRAAIAYGKVATSKAPGRFKSKAPQPTKTRRKKP